jgi:hypothetical protein
VNVRPDRRLEARSCRECLPTLSRRLGEVEVHDVERIDCFRRLGMAEHGL